MSSPVVTALGRVQPNFQGTYDAGTTYNKLDYVNYQGSSYVCKTNGVIGILPTNTGYWQEIAHKGDQGIQGYTGSFGTPNASASILPTGSDPTASVTASGPDIAKVFSFQFGIPAGPLGFSDVAADASATSAGTQPTATAELVGENDKTLSFHFGIPAADGEGVKKVDNIGPSEGGNVVLGAVSYSTAQTLSAGEKLQARDNIGAQSAGNYITDPYDKSYGEFLQYAGTVGDPRWVGVNIQQVPTGGTTGYVLRKQASGYGWTPVYETPAGGNSGSMLTKNSNADYDFVWSSMISTSDIDAIVNE